MDVPKAVVERIIKKEPSTGRALSDALQGDAKERMEEEKTIMLRMTAGSRPEVTFTGFWNGRFIRAAMDSVAKAYRLRRFRPTQVRRPEQGR